MKRPLFSRTVRHISFLWWWVCVIHMLTNHAFVGRLILVGGFVMRGQFSRVFEPFAPSALGAVHGGPVAFLWPSPISAACIAMGCVLTGWMLMRKSPAPPPLR